MALKAFSPLCFVHLLLTALPRQSCFCMGLGVTSVMFKTESSLFCSIVAASAHIPGKGVSCRCPVHHIPEPLSNTWWELFQPPFHICLWFSSLLSSPFLHCCSPVTALPHTCTAPHLHRPTPARPHTCPAPHLQRPTPPAPYTCSVPHLRCPTPALLLTCSVLHLQHPTPETPHTCAGAHLPCSSPAASYTSSALRLRRPTPAPPHTWPAPYLHCFVLHHPAAIEPLTCTVRTCTVPHSDCPQLQHILLYLVGDGTGRGQEFRGGVGAEGHFQPTVEVMLEQVCAGPLCCGPHPTVPGRAWQSEGVVAAVLLAPGFIGLTWSPASLLCSGSCWCPIGGPPHIVAVS